MFDTQKVKELLSFPFVEYAPAENPNPFLVRSARMGCEVCSEDFEIVRDGDYPYFTLHILFEGYSFFHIANQDYFLKKGDAFLITAGEAHSYRNTQNSGLGLLWIELSGNGCKELLNYFSINNIHTIDSLHTKKIAEQLLKILEYVKDHKNPSPYELSAMQYTLIMYLIEAVSTFPRRQISPVITTALEYMGKNFTQNIQICELAESLHISNTYLTSQFRKYLGASPYQYITMKRIEYACYLLDHTELPCQEIAEKTGFYDAAHFHRIFLKTLKTSPSKYRKRKR